MTREDVVDSQGGAELGVVVCSLGAATLMRTVDSVVMSAQRAGTRVEIIVVWQGRSPPPSCGDAVRVLDVFPLGLSYARNRGLALVETPLVAFVDDDEVVDEDWVAAVLAAFRQDPSTVGVFGAVHPLDNEGLPHCLYEGDEKSVFSSPSTPPWIVGTGGNMSFRRSPLLDLNGFDPLFGVGAEARASDESDIIVRLLRRRHVLTWSPEVRVYHPTKSPGDRLATRYPYGFGMGRVVRRHRAPLLGAKYLKAASEYLLEGLRKHDAQQCREAVHTMRGFMAGVLLRVSPRSPPGIINRAPDRIRETLTATRLRPLPLELGTTPRLSYAGEGIDLHIYVSPPGELGEALASDDGSRLVERDRDALWVIVDGVRPRTARH